MFQGVAVDGSTSCIPGQQVFDVPRDDGSDADVLASTPSNSSKKRASSTSTTAESPRKKAKAPYLTAMNNIQVQLEVDSSIMQQEFQENRKNRREKWKMIRTEQKNEVAQCLALAEECGAAEGTAEYFVAISLFEKEYYRDVFFSMKKNESRIAWLRMMAQKESRQ